MEAGGAVRPVLDHRHATFVVGNGERFVQQEAGRLLNVDDLDGQVWCIPDRAQALKLMSAVEASTGVKLQLYLTDAERPLEVLATVPRRSARKRRTSGPVAAVAA